MIILLLNIIKRKDVNNQEHDDVVENNAKYNLKKSDE